MVESSPDASVRPPSRNLCPRCGAPVARAHRRLHDRLISIFHAVRRYRCRAPGCGWEGVLGATAAVPSQRIEPARSHTALIVTGALLLSLIALSSAFVWHAKRAKPMPVAAGHTIAGTLLEPDDPRRKDAEGPWVLRRGCLWGGPGESPYLGTIAAALKAARLPGQIVRKIEMMHEGRIVSDHLEISSAGIRTPDRRRDFGYTADAMILGDTLCYNTKVNPPSGMIVGADLYEVLDDSGRLITVMVVPQGGQVAVLNEQTQR